MLVPYLWYFETPVVRGKIQTFFTTKDLEKLGKRDGSVISMKFMSSWVWWQAEVEGLGV